MTVFRHAGYDVHLGTEQPVPGGRCLTLQRARGITAFTKPPRESRRACQRPCRTSVGLTQHADLVVRVEPHRHALRSAVPSTGSLSQPVHTKVSSDVGRLVALHVQSCLGVSVSCPTSSPKESPRANGELGQRNVSDRARRGRWWCSPRRRDETNTVLCGGCERFTHPLFVQIASVPEQLVVYPLHGCSKWASHSSVTV